MLINILHHTSVGLIPKVLSEIYRIMKPGARLIIIEDSDSLKLRPKYRDGNLLNEFKKFNPEQKKKFFRFFDWISTRLIHGIPEMPRPYNFHSVEEWNRIVSQYHFSVIHEEYLGFPEGSFHLIPKGMLVFKKPTMADFDVYESLRKTRNKL